MRLGTIRTMAVAGMLALGAVGLSAGPAAAGPAPVAPAVVTQSQLGTLTSTVAGSFTDAAGGVGTVAGTFTPTGFSTSDGQIFATGLLNAVLTDSAGNPVGTAAQTVTLPVQLPSGGAVGTFAT